MIAINISARATAAAISCGGKSPMRLVLLSHHKTPLLFLADVEIRDGRSLG
jgi:hypothetical protein